MNQPRYQLKASDNLATYEFLSEGPRGKIVKLIQFTTTNYKDVFNLAFETWMVKPERLMTK